MTPHAAAVAAAILGDAQVCLEKGWPLGPWLFGQLGAVVRRAVKHSGLGPEQELLARQTFPMPGRKRAERALRASEREQVLAMVQKVHPEVILVRTNGGTWRLRHQDFMGHVDTSGGRHG